MKKVVIFSLVLLLIVISSCFTKPETNIEEVDDVNECKSDSDCVIVAGGFCGGAAAINGAFSEAWDKYIEEEIKKNPDVACKETLPLDFFEARCIEGKCEAIQVVE